MTIGFVNDSIIVDEVDLSATLIVFGTSIQTGGVIIVSVSTEHESAIGMLSM